MKFKRFAPKGPRRQRGFINIAAALEWFGRRPTDIREFFRGGNPGLHLQALTPAQNAVAQTMFEDAAGTILIQSAERPVGLWLDTKTGAVPGPNLRASFAVGLVGSATAATYNTGTGAGTVTRVDASNQSYVTITGLTANSVYKVNVTGVSGGTAQVRVGTYSGTVIASGTSSVPCYVVMGASTAITITASAAATVAFTLDACQLIPGNHASQSSAGARPTFTQRVNLLVATEQLDSASWAKQRSSVSANAATAPNGTTTADKLIEDSTASATHRIYFASVVVVASAPIVGSCWFKAAERSYAGIRLTSTGETQEATAVINLSTGEVSTSATSYTAVSASAQAESDGWWRLTITATVPSGVTTVTPVLYVANALTTNHAYTGNGSSGVYVWGADLRTASDAAKAIPAYQRVTTATDYDTDGFPGEVKGNGTSQFMSGTMDLSAVDKVLLVCGLKKYSDAAQGVVFELTASAAANNGGLALCAPAGASATFSALSRGTTTRTATTGTTHAEPKSAVLTAQGDISGDSITTRVNGVADGSDTGDQGTGNYASATYYLFSRAGSSIWSSAGIHSLTIRGGDSSSGSLIGKIENYAKQLARLVY